MSTIAATAASILVAVFLGALVHRGDVRRCAVEAEPDPVGGLATIAANVRSCNCAGAFTGTASINRSRSGPISSVWQRSHSPRWA
jgi:hypothetical protein